MHYGARPRKVSVAVTRQVYEAAGSPESDAWAGDAWGACRLCGEPGNGQALLRFCTHLGKKTSQGWGAVLRWEVELWPEDWSVHGPDGRLMRAVPDPEGETLYGIRPSYWHPRHQRKVRLPA